jgi:hypothetical protein
VAESASGKVGVVEGKKEKLTLHVAGSDLALLDDVVDSGSNGVGLRVKADGKKQNGPVSKRLQRQI